MTDVRPNSSPGGASNAASALSERGNFLLEHQRAEEAEELLRRALELQPGNDLAAFRLALALLHQGRFREAWPYWQRRSNRLQSPMRRLPLPEWLGEPLTGRSIIVVGEQGLGDEIQFARYLPALRRLGAARVTLACNTLNVRALQQLDVDATISRLTTPPASILEEHDCWTQLGSLPAILEAIPRPVSAYLSATASGPGGVGTVSRGAPGHPNDPRRSFPGALSDRFAGALELSPQGDVLDSLSTVAGLDALVTVDTSWAHMAGAIGKRCIVLLPFVGVDWRWMRARPDSVWYRSLRLVRQPSPGDWDSALAEANHILRGWLRGDLEQEDDHLPGAATSGT